LPKWWELRWFPSLIEWHAVEVYTEYCHVPCFVDTCNDTGNMLKFLLDSFFLASVMDATTAISSLYLVIGTKIVRTAPPNKWNEGLKTLSTPKIEMS
jgi:hypothetical protein